MDSIYDHPVYYDVAFSFRDFDREADALAAIAHRYSRIPVRTVFEVACGHAPLLEGLLRRGFAYIGLDQEKKMLAYARERAEQIQGPAVFLRGDLADFQLAEPVDLAFILLGSLYVTSTEALRAHFDCVARALRPGGLYVLDWCIDFIPATDLCETWKESRGDIDLHVTYHSESLDRAEQTYRETVTIEGYDRGRPVHCRTVSVKRAIYPQEFLLFIETRPDFEFVGWWSDWKIDAPLDGPGEINRVVAAIRRV